MLISTSTATLQLLTPMPSTGQGAAVKKEYRFFYPCLFLLTPYSLVLHSHTPLAVEWFLL